MPSRELQRFRASRRDATVDPEALAAFQRDGFAVVEGMLAPDEIAHVKATVMALADKEAENGSAHRYEEKMQRVWNLLDKDEVFHDLMTSPQLLAWMERLFDRNTPAFKYYLSSIQANILFAGARAHKIHVDTPVPEPLPPWIIKANSIWCLDAFTETSGATEVVPGSHLRPMKPRPDRPEDHDGLIKVIAPAGAVVFTHGTLWHRSGANDSGRERAVLLGSFAASYAREIASEEDIVRCVGPEKIAAMSPTLKTIIGYHHGMKPGGRQY